jgi:hypothetical protein
LQETQQLSGAAPVLVVRANPRQGAVMARIILRSRRFYGATDHASLAVQSIGGSGWTPPPRRRDV